MRKILSLLLSAAMLCGLLATQAFAVDLPEGQGEPATQADTDWGSDYDTATEFTISNKNELLAFAEMVNSENDSKNFAGKTVNLINDIDLTDVTWTPIGKKAKYAFCGTFDGDEKTISGLSINGASYCGLFGSIKNGTIKNLTIKSANIICTGGAAGVLVGDIAGTTHIENITVSGSIQQNPLNGTLYIGTIGGIAGKVSSGNNDVSIENCTSDVSLVTNGSSVGGILGSGFTTEITNCINTGEIQGGEATGGIVGYIIKGSVEGCTNSGSVTSTNKRCGGIAGDITESSVTDCENTGAVSAGENNEAGGIVGRAYAESKVTGCTNKGTVNGATSVGGIAGSVVPYGYVSCTISDCTNSGAVTGSSNVGGIAGETSTEQADNRNDYKPNVEIFSCSNSGAVSGETNTGGIVGNHNCIVSSATPFDNGVTPAEVTGCVNTGSVPEGGGAIVGNNNVEQNAGEQAKNHGVVENNFWPESLGVSAVGSGAGSSEDETATDAVKNNSSYKPDGTLTTPVTDDEGEELGTIGDVADKLLGGSNNVPEVLKATVTYNNGGHGTKPDSQSVVIGGKINLPIMDNAGYWTFLNWTAGGTEYAAGAEYTVTADVTFTAQWRNDTPSTGGSSSSDPTYSIDLPSRVTGGEVKTSPRYAEKGDTVTLTVTPDDGYELDEIIVTDRKGNELDLTDKGNGKFTFKMPASRVDVEVTFVKVADTQTNPFYDVSADAYYYEAVLWAVENEITGGTSATTFSPNAPCTRAQIVTFLWRAAGSPRVDGVTPFVDVDAGAYYADAVAWAVQNGITGGTTATTFDPNATVTRGQTVTFLYRAAGSPATSGSGFSDVPADAYYTNAVAWAVENAITNGTTATTFAPANPCTRAQIVTFLFRDRA